MKYKVQSAAAGFTGQRHIDYADSYPLRDTTVLYYWRATYWRRLTS